MSSLLLAEHQDPFAAIFGGTRGHGDVSAKRRRELATRRDRAIARITDCLALHETAGYSIASEDLAPKAGLHRDNDELQAAVAAMAYAKGQASARLSRVKAEDIVDRAIAAIVAFCHLAEEEGLDAARKKMREVASYGSSLA